MTPALPCKSIAGYRPGSEVPHPVSPFPSLKRKSVLVIFISGSRIKEPEPQKSQDTSGSGQRSEEGSQGKVVEEGKLRCERETRKLLCLIWPKSLRVTKSGESASTIGDDREDKMILKDPPTYMHITGELCC